MEKNKSDIISDLAEVFDSFVDDFVNEVKDYEPEDTDAEAYADEQGYEDGDEEEYTLTGAEVHSLIINAYNAGFQTGREDIHVKLDEVAEQAKI